MKNMDTNQDKVNIQGNNLPHMTRKQFMLSLVEVLYNSSAINDATYIEVKKAIKKEVLS